MGATNRECRMNRGQYYRTLISIVEQITPGHIPGEHRGSVIGREEALVGVRQRAYVCWLHLLLVGACSRSDTRQQNIDVGMKIDDAGRLAQLAAQRVEHLEIAA